MPPNFWVIVEISLLGGERKINVDNIFFEFLIQSFSFTFFFNSIEEVVNCLPYSPRSIESMVHSLKHFWFQYFCTFLSIIKPSLIVCTSVYFYTNYSALRKLYNHLQDNKSLKFCFILPMVAILLFFFNIYEHELVHFRSLKVFSSINFLWDILERQWLKDRILCTC